MSDVRYTNEHEWARVEGEIAIVGISDYAQKQLGDVVFVELPAPGKQVTKGGEMGTVESVKAASEVFSPVSGEVVEVNTALNDDPALVNSEPLGRGWFVKVRMKDKREIDTLMDEAAYREWLKGLK